jgi:hypothetical protein
MSSVIDERPIAHRYRLLAPHLTERELHLWAATEATVHGPGAIAAVARATGITAAAIRRAQRELRDQPPATDPQRSSG